MLSLFSLQACSSSLFQGAARAAVALATQQPLPLPLTTSTSARHHSGQPAAAPATAADTPSAASPPPSSRASITPSTSQHSSRPPQTDMATPGHTRKPAILKPALHQWRLCSPSYDPSQPPPSQHLPPYAPSRARRTNYRALMLDSMPTSHNRNHHRRAWKHGMLVAMNAWRRKHEHSAAAASKQQEYARAVDKHLRREQAWKQWCRQHPDSVHRGAA